MADPMISRLREATLTDTRLQIEGYLNSTPNTLFRLDFYWSETCDPLYGYGEGRVHLFDSWQSTDSSGYLNIETAWPPFYGSGFITVTATAEGSGTSEFSNCIEIRR